MIKGQSVIGKGVLSRLDGERLDPVKDLVIGKDHRSIVALLLTEGGIFSSPTVVAFQNVVSFGKDAVIVNDSKAAVAADRLPEVKAVLDNQDSLIGKTLFSETGDQHGKVVDLYFDEANGQILKLDVTVGTGEGAQGTEATAMLDMQDVVSIGPDAVIVVGGTAAKLSSGSAAVSATTPDSVPGPASARLSSGEPREAS